MKIDAKHRNDLLEDIRNYGLEFEALVLDRLGISIRHQKPELENTILYACKKFQCSPKEYLEKLKSCSESSPYLEDLIIGITIGETYFYRDKNQMKLLNEQVLPDLIQKKRLEKNLSIRIWSAGCSSGEEIFTVGMMLLQHLQDIDKWTINLLGTDINTRVLQKAISGRYNEWSMRAIAADFKQRYFTYDNKQYELSSKVREFADFAYLNLNEDTYPSIFNGTNAQDLILCRNVLIYFDNARIKYLMNKFYNCLVPGGYLLLGASDPIDNSETKLVFHHQKGMLFSRSDAESVEIIKSVAHPVIKNEIKPLPSIKVQPHIPGPKAVKAANVTLDQDELTKFLNEFQWEKILSVAEMSTYKENELVILYNAKAMALANLGQLEKAALYCKKSVALDQAHKFTYFTFALVMTELNRLAEAENALRKTLFLDHQFIAAHFQLGLLLLKKKQINQGIKCLINALSIAKQKNASEIVPGSAGVTYGSFAETLKHEIDLYMESGAKQP